MTTARTNIQLPTIGGHQFLPPYLLLKEAGGGGMGVVYEAWDVISDSRVAVKIMSKVDMPDRFVEEAIYGVKDLGPHAVRVLALPNPYEGHRHFPMEWVEGQSLAGILKGGPLPEGQVVNIGQQVCAGLARIHGAGIIHRDIKPGNVMVSLEGVAKVADFGIAKSSEGFHQTTGGPICTPVFASPEQRMGAAVDERSDIYSLGMLLLVLLEEPTEPRISGRVAMLRDDPRSLESVLPDATPALRELILHCIEREPAARPSSADEVAQALAALGVFDPELPVKGRDDVPTPPTPEILRRAREEMAKSRASSGSGGAPGSYGVAPTATIEPKPAPMRRLLLPALVAVALILVGANWLLDERDPDEGGPQGALAHGDDPEEQTHVEVQEQQSAEGAAAEETPTATDANDSPIASGRTDRAQETPGDAAPEGGVVPGKLAPLTESLPKVPADKDSLNGFKSVDPSSEAKAPTLYVPAFRDGALSKPMLDLLQFVRSEFRSEMMVCTYEVPRILVEALKVPLSDEQLKGDAYEPLGYVDEECANKIVDALNELWGDEVGHRFVLPAPEHYQAVALDWMNARGVTVAKRRPPAPREEVKTGWMDSTVGAPLEHDPRFELMSVKRVGQAWGMPEGFPLHGLIGNAREFVHGGPDMGSGYVNHASDALRLSSQREGIALYKGGAPQILRNDPTFRNDGLRLIIELVDER